MLIRRRLFFAGFVVLALVSIGLSARLLWQSQLHHWQIRFATYVKDASADVRHALDTNEAVLAGFSAFLQAVEQSDEAAAHRYAAAVLPAYPHMYMLEVARAVPIAEQAQFEALMRANWRADFAFKDFSALAHQTPQVRAALDETWPLLFMHPELPEASAVYGVRLETVGYLSHALAKARRDGRAVASPVFTMYEGGNAYVLAQMVDRSQQGHTAASAPNFFGSSMMALLLVRTDALLQAVHGAAEEPLVGIHATLSTTPASASPVFSKPAEPAEDWERRFLPLLQSRVEIESSTQPMVLTFERQLRAGDMLETEMLAILAALATLLALLPVAVVRYAKAVRVAESEHERSAFLATHDMLTGLPNRFVLADRFAQAVAQAQRRDTSFALLVIDLDHFKQINDQHGHAVGDQVLKATAERMLTVSRASDTVARFGGDEFVMLIGDVADPADAQIAARKVLEAVRRPISTSRGVQQLACSIGVAFYPADGERFDDLLAAADQAMYRVKDDGRAGIALSERADAICR